MKNYKVVQTDDGSITYYSELYGENCHSLSGAKEETLTHYINGCQVIQKASLSKSLTILEVGLGTGLGYELTLEALKDFSIPIHFISLEIDQELVDLFHQNHTSPTKNIKVTIVQGDARKTLPKYLKENKIKFNCIYQDAFSPKRNADLWTLEWFQLLKEYSSEDCILSTYSSSSSIRKTLCEAQWALSEGEKFGTKRSSTRAHAQGVTEQTILEKLSRSPAPIITDQNAKDYTL